MSWNRNRHGLPFLPGFTFPDVTKSAFHRSQTLEYKNGFRVPRHQLVGIGKDPLLAKQLIQQEIGDFLFETPAVTTKFIDQDQEDVFVPFYVALDKKVLRFYGYFKEDVLYSPEEDYRVRPVVLYYYLEDDTMCIVEPRVENSGLPQGTRIKRQRLPKTDTGVFYLWKDLNLAMDLEVYGVKYRIVQCDAFTQEFLQSEGIVVNDPEQMPVDPYIKRRENPQPCYTTPSEFDRMYKFLTLDRMVLRFFALWEDADSLQGETRPVTIQYFLSDDTVEIRMVHEPNSGRDPYTVLMRRQNLPKKIKLESATFPSCVLEISSQEVDEYYSPKDFKLGQRIKLMSRSFLLYDCDSFTKEYYEKNHPEIEIKPVVLPKKIDKLLERKKEVPPYNGYGSLEDSLQNCLALIPKRPKKDVLKMLENSNMVLRYSAKLVSQNPDNDGRCFVLSYFPSNDMVSIFENPVRNSGITSGKFLEKTRVPKPGSTVNNPEFYSPADFAIGATIDVFSHRFLLTDADLFVLTYLEANASKIPPQTLESVRRKVNADARNEQPAEQSGASS